MNKFLFVRGEQGSKITWALYLACQAIVNGDWHYNHKTGICSALDDIVPGYLRNHVLDLFRAISMSWPEYTGNNSFPIPHEKYAPTAGYYIEENLWVGKYGEARMRLLKYIVKQLESSLDKSSPNIPAGIICLMVGRKIRGLEAKGGKPRGGICIYMRTLARVTIPDRMFRQEVTQAITDQFPLWPKYSGCKECPVPHPDFPDPCDGYMAASCGDGHWHGKYGAARRELLQYCAHSLLEPLSFYEKTRRIIRNFFVRHKP